MGTGGMRWGAGRPAYRMVAEHCRRLDVNRWHREGFLRPGVCSGWQWTDAETGEARASIGFSVSESAVTLRYSMNGVAMTQHVPLARTACNYGGARPWFQCPRCSRRVGVLFLRANGFACRHCQRLSYATQREDVCGRTWRRQAKLEARLGEHWKRPKGMHRVTHERLLNGVVACEERRDTLLALFLDRCMSLL